MDLDKLTQGLALLKHGLDDLDSQCTQQAAQCMQLRQAVLQQQRQRQAILQQSDVVTAEIHERQELVDDLTTVRNCLTGQVAAACGSKEHLQVCSVRLVCVLNDQACWAAAGLSMTIRVDCSCSQLRHRYICASSVP